MHGNHLESLVAEWCQYHDFFVRRNVPVGPAKHGGYTGELDNVAYKLEGKHLVHIEISIDAGNPETVEERYFRKFESGRKYVRNVLGLGDEQPLDQVALFVTGWSSRQEVGGVPLHSVKDFMCEVLEALPRLDKSILPEQLPLLRTLQFAKEHWPLPADRPKVTRHLLNPTATSACPD